MPFATANLVEILNQIALARRLERSLGLSVISPTLAVTARQSNLRSVSLHEAGHATVALVLGGSFWGAVAGTTSDLIPFDGVACASFCGDTQYERMAAFTLGGYAAEGTFSSSDFLLFFTSYANLTGNILANVFFERCLGRAERILRRHADLHEALAAVLQEAGVLFAHDAARIARRHGVSVHRPTKKECAYWAGQEPSFQAQVKRVAKPYLPPKSGRRRTSRPTANE